MKKIDVNNSWEMHRVGDDDWIMATVPGSVYGDLLQAGKMEDPFWKDNEIEALKLMDYDYEYRTSFSCDDELLGSDEVILRFEGLDTIADITLNGVKLGHADNMHRTWEYSVKDTLKHTDNILSVYFYSPTKFIADAFAKAPTRGTEDAMNGFVHIRKAHCMFGWDWGAHLPDAGIWRPVSLLGIDTARIDSVEILQHHGQDSVELDIKPEIEFARKYIGSGSETGQLSVKVRVVDPAGNEIINRILNEDITKNIHIDNPQLWWPRGYGEQNLYTVSVDLVKDDGTVVDNWTRKIGLRTITMDRTKDKWGESFATCVNGVNIFAMLGSGQELVRLPFEFPKSIRLCVANETMNMEKLLVSWQLRDASARVLESHEEEITAPALTSVWLDKVELPGIDIYHQYVSYQASMKGQVISEGTVIFSYPKYFCYEEPHLQATVDGDYITVSADAYAKSVEILNQNEDLILSDNYFDLNADSKTVKVISGSVDKLRLRSVYDIS